MILVDAFIKFNLSEEFRHMFLYVIQLAAIFAVLIMFWDKLCPWTGHKTVKQQRITYQLWVKVIIGCLPAAVIGIPFNDFFEQFETPVVVAATLIIYGIIFIVLEYYNQGKAFAIRSTARLPYSTAFFIGCFQCLALIPGTSRSGATILGAMLLGVSRTAAAEFSFFLSCPVMFGSSAIKVLKFLKSGASMSGQEWMILFVGCLVSFLVSMLCIKLLMDFVKKHSFSAFGVYRIIVGILVLVYFFVLA
mgnify:CR=1 FL=1